MHNITEKASKICFRALLDILWIEEIMSRLYRKKKIDKRHMIIVGNLDTPKNLARMTIPGHTIKPLISNFTESF